jgi:methyltransferase (TIGR00027 family)
MNQVIQNVSDTAFLVAGFRAAETEREKPLFRDPLAAKLAGDHGRNILATVPRSFVSAWSVVIRTMIIDGFIKQAIADGVGTILNLGAGLDTRPYRMELRRSLRWIEVDYPDVIELKETRLADEVSRCRLERLALDLTDRATRKAFLAGVNAEAGKILVLTEGLTPYLTEADVGALADDLRQTDKVRFWINDYFSPEALKFGAKVRRKFMRNAPFQFAPKDWFAFFIEHGWQASEVRHISEEADRLGRPIPLPFGLRLWVKVANIFASRARRERMRRFAAYVLLTPK